MINHPRRSKSAISATPAALKPKRKTTLIKPRHDHDADWEALLGSVMHTFMLYRDQPLFQTDAELWPLYLQSLKPTGEKQVHDCHACRSFVKHFGGLAYIGEDGQVCSALWSPVRVPKFYLPTVNVLAHAVSRAKVVGPFLSPELVWGQPATRGGWTHFVVGNVQMYNHALLTAGQAMAAKRENFKDVKRALGEFTPGLIDTALRILEEDLLTRSEKFIAPLKWLKARHDERTEAFGRKADNLLWHAIATAPEGYCHPRAGVTGSLMEDLAAGMSFDVLKKRWTEKMHPLRYQRPQAAPKIGAIANAEKIFENLNLARSLERRFARLDEIEVSWVSHQQRMPTRRQSGLFGHLAAHQPLIKLPSSTLTWAKFMDKVLPGAEQLEVYCENRSMPFIGLTTAVHDHAPPILKWDRDDERNPFAWYVYHQGSHPNHWNLATGWRKVAAITQLPPMWGDRPQKHFGESFVLVIEGCTDSRQPGNALFPEYLRQELHAVRSVIEADCRTRKLAGQFGANANGLDVRAGNRMINYRLRVTRGGHASEYTIDRWD